VHDVAGPRHRLDVAELDPFGVPDDRGSHPRECGILEPMEQRRLTSFSHGAGCGCKLGPTDLETVLGTLSLPELKSDVLVAAGTGDGQPSSYRTGRRRRDARLLPPIVDDLRLGRIA
jgi:hypothetical protein